MAYMDDVLTAIRDPEWQKFRRSLKGMDTASKLNNLKDYYLDNSRYWSHEYHDGRVTREELEHKLGKVSVQVDNYLKALARGGQLHAGASLDQALAWNWNLRIRK